jgi:hypothetical protein
MADRSNGDESSQNEDLTSVCPVRTSGIEGLAERTTPDDPRIESFLLLSRRIATLADPLRREAWVSHASWCQQVVNCLGLSRRGGAAAERERLWQDFDRCRRFNRCRKFNSCLSPVLGWGIGAIQSSHFPGARALWGTSCVGLLEELERDISWMLLWIENPRGLEVPLITPKSHWP